MAHITILIKIYLTLKFWLKQVNYFYLIFFKNFNGFTRLIFSKHAVTGQAKYMFSAAHANVLLYQGH